MRFDKNQKNIYSNIYFCQNSLSDGLALRARLGESVSVAVGFDEGSRLGPALGASDGEKLTVGEALGTYTPEGALDTVGSGVVGNPDGALEGPDVGTSEGE